MLEGLIAGDLPVRDHVVLDVGHQPFDELMELLLVGDADGLQPLQPPFAVQHGIVVPRSVQHVRFVQLAL